MSRYDALLLDAFGTLVELDDPYGRLARSLAEWLGAEPPRGDVERAFRAEMRFYESHCHEGRDAESLERLRAQCAAIVVAELGVEGEPAEAAGRLMEAIRFRVFDDVPPLLAAAGDAGVATAVVSNWDHSLPDVLAGAGLRFDVVVDSATAGAAKPDPAIFRVALDRLGVEPARTLHVGDRPASDGAGARAAGVDVRVLRRGGEPGPGEVASLRDVVPLLR